MQANTSKLVRVYCAIKHTSRGTRYIYTGFFEDGTQRKIRDCFNCYVSVAQMERNCYGRNEGFKFSSKPSVALSSYEIAMAQVPIGLDTAE